MVSLAFAKLLLIRFCIESRDLLFRLSVEGLELKIGDLRFKMFIILFQFF